MREKKTLIAGTGKSGIAAAEMVLKMGGGIILYNTDPDCSEEAVMRNFNDGDDVEFIFGSAFREDMQDEMTITVIAAGFDIEDSKEQTEEPITVDNPLIDDVKVSGGQGTAAQQSKQHSSDLDDFTAIFNILDRK